MAKRKNRRKTALKLTALFLSLLLVMMVSIYAVRLTRILGSELVYEDIFINDHLVSGLTYDELEEYLLNNYQYAVEEISFEVRVKDTVYTASLKDFNVKYDIVSTVDKIYTIGREGTMLEKLATISKTKDDPLYVNFNYIYDESLIDEFVSRIYEESYFEKIPSFYSIKLDEMKVDLQSGIRGETIDKDLLKSEIKAIVDNAKDNVIITVGIIYDELNTINGEDIFNRTYIQHRNAGSDIIGKEIRIVPHQVGRAITAEELKEAVDRINSTENLQLTVEIKDVFPDITSEIYESNLFKSTLGSSSSQFYQVDDNTKARAVNIKLATDAINGTIIAPGQTFSFNNVVGPRTAARGYQVAHVYESGAIVDGIGGGICQPSSTLYNTVLYADLKVTDRRNHMFIVNYVPLGTDATVDFGSQDFKFMNDTEYPIRIDGEVTEDNKVIFKIIGTDPDPSTTVKLKSVTLQTIPFETVYVDDPTLDKGTSIVKHSGMNGYVAEAFKVYYRNGSVVKEVSLGVSRYSKYDKVIRVGTR